MAYRFLPSESFEDGLRRNAVEQVSHARRALQTEPCAPVQIHEARKAIKRLRALLQIVRPGLRERTFRKENAELREIANRLSGPRRFDALEETITKLETHFGIKPGGMTTRARLRLAEQRDAHVSGASAPAVESALHNLARADARLTGLRLRAAGLGMICNGLARPYKRGRRKLKRAYASGLDEDFHDFRKAVQQHWRHMQLMSNAWPQELGARVKAARELSQILGDDHDLSELAALMSNGRPALAAEDRMAMTGLAAARQHQLRALALPRAKRLFAEPARDIRQRIRIYWRLARQMSYMEPTLLAGQERDAQVIALKT